MTYKPTIEGIRLEFESEFDADRYPLVSQRAQFFTQQEMAEITTG